MGRWCCRRFLWSALLCVALVPAQPFDAANAQEAAGTDGEVDERCPRETPGVGTPWVPCSSLPSPPDPAPAPPDPEPAPPDPEPAPPDPEPAPPDPEPAPPDPEPAPPNTPPTIGGVPASLAWVAQGYVFQPVADDGDGDALQFWVANAPTWVAFDPQTGRLEGTPGIEHVGLSGDMVIGVSDGQASATLPPFSIDVREPLADNRAPIIEGSPPGIAWVGQEYVLEPMALDPDGDPILFEIAGAPPWTVFDPQTGRLAGIPGPYDVGPVTDIVIRVTDGNATSAMPSFEIDVRELPAVESTVLHWIAPTENTDGSPLTDLAGFVVRYGNSPLELDLEIRIPSPLVTSCEFLDLWPADWYFEVVAYNAAGVESAPSNRAVKYVP